MAQTIQMGEQVTAAPVETGIPRLLSALDFDGDIADQLAAYDRLLSLRVDLEPITDRDTKTTEEIAISCGYAGSGYEAAIPEWPQITRQIAATDPERDGIAVGGGARTAAASLTIANERSVVPNLADDDDYSASRDAWIEDYDWDQRPATIAAIARRRETDEIVAGPLVILKGKTREIGDARDGSFTLEVADLLDRLDRIIQSVRLAGDGTGDEGGAELAGARPPILMGTCYNMPGILVATVPNHRYLLHRDRIGLAIQGVSAVYVGANALTGGQYTVSLGESNTVTITSGLDDTKQVTFTATGPLDAGATIADHVRYVLSVIGPLDTTEIDSDALSIFRALTPFASGWRIGQEETYSQVLDAMTAKWAIWRSNSATGKITARLNIDPALDFTDYSLPLHAIRDVTPLPITPRAASIVTGWRKNWTQVTSDGVADAALSSSDPDVAEYARWAQQPHYRIAEPLGDLIDELDPSAALPQDWETPFLDEGEARIIHRRIVNLFAPRWRSYRVIADARAMRFEPGSVVEFSWPRWTQTDEARAYRIQSVKILNVGGAVAVELLVSRPDDVSVLAGDTTDDYLVFDNDDPLLVA